MVFKDAAASSESNQYGGIGKDRESKNDNKTVIFSSHIMSEVDLLCDDLAIINNGSIIYNDSFEQFKKEMKADNLTQEFINRAKEA